MYLSVKEGMKAAVLDRIVAGEITAGEGARRLSMSIRQVFRLKARIRESGLSSLVHGNRGRRPSNSFSEEIGSIVRSKGTGEYRGASLNHMSELLERNDGVLISAKSVGRILKEAGIALSHGRKGRKRYRSRKRRERFGSLVQLDATPFDWLENGSVWSLHGAIDDATGMVLSLRFEKEECSAGYLHVLEEMVRTWGIPASLYSDRHTIFFSPMSEREKRSEEDILEGRKVPLTRYGTMLDLLGIEHIAARTPQAKGRIERLWGTCQHRLLVEMRVAGVRTMDEANAFLSTYRTLHNGRFTVKAEDEGTDFLPSPPDEQLRLILGYREERKVAGGSEISWYGKKYHLVDERGGVLSLARGETVTVIRTSDGMLYGLRKSGTDEAVYRLTPCSLRESARQGRGTEAGTGMGTGTGANKNERREKCPSSPSPDHPWRETWRFGKRKRAVYEDMDPLETSDDISIESLYGHRVS